MKALLLAGGLGTRLRPLTYTRPKHLLPIANKPHIEHVLELLERHDIRDVVLTTSYLAEAFAGTLVHARERGMRVEVTHEKQPLGTAGAIKHAEELLLGEAFVVFNADVLTDADLTALIGFHCSREAEATLLLTPVDDPSRFGVVSTDDDGKVRGFIEKPSREQAPTNLINAGVYIFEPSVLERIPPGEMWSAEHQLFPELVGHGRMYATALDAYWTDIGTPRAYLEANLDAVSGKYQVDRVEGDARDGVVAASSASIAESARVSSACIGAGATVEQDATVDRSVLLPGARIGQGAKVRESVIGEDATVDSGAIVEDQAVADGDSIVKGQG